MHQYRHGYLEETSLFNSLFRDLAILILTSGNIYLGIFKPSFFSGTVRFKWGLNENL